MGLMKRINTAMTLHRTSLQDFAPDERKAIRAILRDEESLRQYQASKTAPVPTAGGQALCGVSLGAIYTGNRPEKAGLYYVIDTVAEYIQSVTVSRSDTGTWRVGVVGHSDMAPLDNFNRQTYHWFLLLELTPDDFELIGSELP